LAVSLDINQEYVPFERGVPTNDLWGLYAVSDVYLQPSKAEGLGLPVLDAMAAGIPVVATDTGAMSELLMDGRGLRTDAEYVFTDVWGNSSRSMISIEKAKEHLKWIANSDHDDNQDDYHYRTDMVRRALDYVRSRTWDIPVKQIHDKITEICNEQKL
jgi:glycosyltransferase involved in cell wall biosynthesis